MGYLDRQLTGSSGQSLAQVVGSYFSTDVIDLAAAGRDLGRINEMRAYSVVGAAVTSGGAGTLIAQLVESANPDLSAPNVLYQSNGGVALAIAALGAGTILADVAVPATTQRYLGWRYVIAGATLTGGTVTSTIVPNTNSPAAARPLGNTGVL